jgi:hypothetical protein
VTALANNQVLLKAAGPVVAGVPTGTNGHVLTLVAGAPSWAVLPIDPGFANPLTTAGDLLVGGVSGTPTRLGLGATNRVLTVSGGAPSWQPLPIDPGFASPLTNVGDLIVGSTGGLATRLAAAISGAVFASAGVNTTPVWSVSPALTDLKLGGGTIGTSGVGVLALSTATAPTTSPSDTLQLYTHDMDAEGGSRSLSIRDERGSITRIGSTSSEARVQINPVLGGQATLLGVQTVAIKLSLDATGIGGHHIGLDASGSIHPLGPGCVALYNHTIAKALIIWTPGAELYMTVAGSASYRHVTHGAPDSGAPGYRTLLIQN